MDHHEDYTSKYNHKIGKVDIRLIGSATTIVADYLRQFHLLKFKQNKLYAFKKSQFFKLATLTPFNERRYSKISWSTVSFTDLDQGREILSRFSLPKSMKHSVRYRKNLGFDKTKLNFCSNNFLISENS